MDKSLLATATLLALIAGFFYSIGYYLCSATKWVSFWTFLGVAFAIVAGGVGLFILIELGITLYNTRLEHIFEMENPIERVAQAVRGLSPEQMDALFMELGTVEDVDTGLTIRYNGFEVTEDEIEHYLKRCETFGRDLPALPRNAEGTISYNIEVTLRKYFVKMMWIRQPDGRRAYWLDGKSPDTVRKELRL